MDRSWFENGSMESGEKNKERLVSPETEKDGKKIFDLLI